MDNYEITGNYQNWMTTQFCIDWTIMKQENMWPKDVVGRSLRGGGQLARNKRRGGSFLGIGEHMDMKL